MFVGAWKFVWWCVNASLVVSTPRKCLLAQHDTVASNSRSSIISGYFYLMFTEQTKLFCSLLRSLISKLVPQKCGVYIFFNSQRDVFFASINTYVSSY